MTVEASIVSALTGLVSGRVYPDVAPQASALPRIVYQQVGGEAISFLERSVPSKQNGRFQIACWATTRAAAAALALQVEAAMVASTAFQLNPIGAPIADHEPDTGLYGTRQDFSIWTDR